MLILFTMKSLIVLAVLSIAAKHISALTVDCSKSSDGLTLTAVLREASSASAVQLEAINKDNGVTNKCVSTLDTSGGTSGHVLTITVLLSSQSQIVPLKSTSDCYVQAPTQSETNYVYNIVVKKDINMIRIDDTLYMAKCDPAAAGPQTSEVTNGVPVANVLTSTDASVISDDIAASLVDNADQAVTAADLGKEVKLRVTYTLPTGLTAGQYAQALQIYSVELSGYSDFRTVYNLYTSNGCINQTAQAALSTTAGITYNDAASTSGTTHVFDTGLFKTAIFDGPAPKTMYIRFSYNKSCLSVTDEKCANHELYCTNNALTRKKRSVNNVLPQSLRVKRNTNTKTNGTLSFSVPIKLHKDGTANAIGGSGSNAGSTVEKESQCEIPDMYWIIAVVLGFLLLCMMVLCVFLVLRLRKEQNQARHISDKLGHQNSGYRY